VTPGQNLKNKVKSYKNKNKKYYDDVVCTSVMKKTKLNQFNVKWDLIEKKRVRTKLNTMKKKCNEKMILAKKENNTHIN